jgi:iron complex outermembrane receptor protein
MLESEKIRCQALPPGGALDSMSDVPVCSLPRARLSVLVSLALAVIAGRAVAQEPSVVAPEVKVRAATGGEEGSGRAQNTVTREELRRRDLGTLGAALADTPGVNNASFGPGVGLPVIRGMSQSRVRVNVGGLGSHDASTLSPDHAVAAEPLLADRIRVIRGPATVRYGSGAIGGAVEVEDARIPTAAREGARVSAEGRYNTNGNGRQAALRADGGKGRLRLHVDGYGRARDDIRIPGAAIDEAAVLRQFRVQPRFNSVGYVAGTDSRAHGGSVGAALVDEERGFAGFSVGSMSNNYGLPAGTHVHITDPNNPVPHVHSADDRVRVDMQQTRVDSHALLALPGGFAETLEFKGAYVNYRHDELDNARPVTTFRNEAREGRLELAHRWSEQVSGVVGLHGVSRRFSALGIATFVPESDVRSNAAFLIEQFELGRFRLEGSVRQEQQVINAQPQTTIYGDTLVHPETRFRPLSYALAGTWQHDPRNAATLTWSRAERAPDLQELYSFGPHLGTRSFNVGDPTLAKETLVGLDLGLRGGLGPFDASLNVFNYRADRFIYLENTGLFFNVDRLLPQFNCVRLELCLPILQYAQRDATLRGYEVQVSAQLPDAGTWANRVTVFADYTRGQFANGAGDIPRMPPRRTGVQLGTERDKFGARLRYTYGSAQNNPGLNETPTAAYNLLNLYVDYRVVSGGRYDITTFLNATNLLDEEIRNATSFLRSFAPEPGRAFEFGVRATF